MSVAAEPGGHGLRESDPAIDCLEHIILLVERCTGEAMADTLPRTLTVILYADTVAIPSSCAPTLPDTARGL